MVSQKLERIDEEFIAKATDQAKKGQYLTPIIVADRLVNDLYELTKRGFGEVHDLGCGPGGLSSAVLRKSSDVRLVETTLIPRR